MNDKLRQLQETFQTGRLLGNMVWNSGPWLLICIIFFMLAEAITPVLQLYALKNIIDGVVKQDEIVQTEMWTIIYAGSLVVLGAIQSLEKWVKTLLGERAVITVNSMLIDAFERIPGMRFFEDPKYRDKLETLRDRSTWLPSQFIYISSSLFTAIASLSGVVLLIAYLSPMLAVILVFSTAPFAFVHNHYNEMEWEYNKEYAPVRRKAAYTRNLLLNRRAAKEIRLFGLGAFFLNLYQATFQTLYRVLKIIQIRSARWSVLAGFLSGAGTGLGYFWILSRSNSPHFTAGDISLYLGAVLQLSIALRDIAKEGADTLDIWRMGRDFVHFMNAKKDMILPEKAKSFATDGALAVEFKNVSFRYPNFSECEDQENERADVLNELSFSISKGERIAIVGANGSGKTTLIKLLCRFYEYQEGDILINGINIKELDLHQLRNRISVVFQEFGKYELSLKNNIALGDWAALDQEKLVKAAQAAELKQLIDDLPEGLDTMIGPEWGGTDFSGGQWQRIALARSFIKDAGLVILDEPSASLDIRAEYEIFRQFHRFTQGKTVIMISHRFSTVKMADRILVLKNGRIIEAGSHSDLMKQNGEYRKMFQLQAQVYQGKDEGHC
ncbi:ABC transporter ATP-binding protein [Bacillus sp. WMMC1349]|uniref:ABC transporter ATP-binding protein n=1 Tax=Bacillus sp. WMMC1349 TaxID=2736254 RepID=UPI0015547977|nr:ABC transporter ATP-binding protein [Bacillus sp. WMMC1349]NPC94547.1 ABC transporter ATP-binding protein [Bacillus sp. WMMC1349]